MCQATSSREAKNYPISLAFLALNYSISWDTLSHARPRALTRPRITLFLLALSLRGHKLLRGQELTYFFGYSLLCKATSSCKAKNYPIYSGSLSGEAKSLLGPQIELSLPGEATGHKLPIFLGSLSLARELPYFFGLTLSRIHKLDLALSPLPGIELPCFFMIFLWRGHEHGSLQLSAILSFFAGYSHCGPEVNFTIKASLLSTESCWGLS